MPNGRGAAKSSNTALRFRRGDHASWLSNGESGRVRAAFNQSRCSEFRNDWRMEIGNVYQDGGPSVGFVEHPNCADTRIRSTGRGGLPGERGRRQRVHPRCIQVVQQTHSRRYPDHDLPPTEGPLSLSGMSGRVYEPVPTVSAIARGATHFRFAKFGGKVVSNTAGSRRRRDQHEIQSE